jgi:prolipoprotein diacylglyceryltransferase
MLPELYVDLPGNLYVTVGTHALVTLMAVLVAMVFVARHAPGTGLAALAPVAALVVLGGSRALYHVLDGGSSLGAGGLASMGGVAAGLIAARPLARVARVPTPRLLDALVPAALLALGIGRIGCFLAGCCYGMPTGVPWGVVFPALGGPPRHPLQLYSAVADLAIAYAVCRRKAAPGERGAGALAAFAVARFALETLRDPGTTDTLPYVGLTLPQGLCIVLLLAVRWWARHSLGGLSRAGHHGTVPRRMRPAALPLLLLALAAAQPAIALDAQFISTLAVRPARGRLDIATGQMTLEVRRWHWVPAAGSDGIDPAGELITLMLGSDTILLPAGAVTEPRPGRYAYRDRSATHGFTQLRMKRGSNGSWLVSFRVAGMDQIQLVSQFALCVPLALVIGNDAGVSGVDLDRPRGAESPRVKLRGFCQIEGCPTFGLGSPRHVICPF